MTTLQEQARALGDPTRHAIFRRIAEADQPIGVSDLNEGFSFNHNAIRQHLAKLVDAGLVIETTAPPIGRGRPRLVYTIGPAVEGKWGTTGPYERLSRLLIEIIRSGLDPQEVGRLAADEYRVPSPSGDVVADINAAMARQGFDPETRAVGAGAELVLHNCSFATAALADRATICALHLGIAEGLAAGTDVTVEELIAYEPRKAGCRVRLRFVADDPDSPGGTLRLRGRVGAR
jgi:predicted ArsR family transcriptional regulator